MILIFVESPSKAKAINEYLKGSKENFIAIATMGHIRNLSRKSGSINVNQDFEYTWEFTTQWEKNKQKILKEAKQADQIIIASDPDREGEAIAWHLKEVLRVNKINCDIERMIFHSISKQSILEALNNKTGLRIGLINSYLARVGLDYLFGYSVSPLLWRKVPCCKSAGRVQSASLKLIVDKENEIQNFKRKNYITVHSDFEEIDDALLIQMNNEKFENGNIFDLNLIKLDDIRKNAFKIIAIDKSKQKQNPPSPLITSKLQQLASSQLNFSPTITMQLAQKLYEGFSINGKHTGLITYMRTDSFHIEDPAVDLIRKKIELKYGKGYLSNKILDYKKTVKNAQEAHEAIRPIDINLEPEMISFPDENLKKLYNLIWARTLATQFSPAILEKTSIKIENKDTENNYLFEINDTFIAFDSFKKIIQNENNDDKEAKKIDLSKITIGQELNCTNLYSKDHETQPPKRYSEATFINQLEKLGIGRPSTYAKISSVLFEREYIEKQKKAILPTQKGWLVTAFLDKFFEKEIQHEFTSKMEEKLDDISNKNEKYKPMIEDFWNHIKKLIDKAQTTSPLEVAKFIEEKYPTYFKSNESKCECGADLVLKITKFGAMRGCINYPDCKKTEAITEYEKTEFNIIGSTENNKPITFKNGPYGYYLEIQQDVPKRISIPKNLITDGNIDPILAHELTKLPKIIGEYNEKEIKINIGRFGLYLEYDKKFISISSPTISYENAIEKIKAKINSPKTISKKS